MNAPLFTGQIKIEKSEKGYCTVLRDGKQTLVFYPDSFTPDTCFYSELEKYMLRSYAELIWIENPEETYQFWRCASIAIPNGCIRLGQYCIYLISELSRSENSVVYKGEFMCGDACFETSDITLDLSSSWGTLSFSFAYHGDKNIFDALDAGMKFVLPLAADAKDRERRGFVSAAANCILSYNGSESFKAHITPCAFFDVSKTHISLPQISYSSSLSTVGGMKHTLKACANAALVFETTARTAAYDASAKKWEACSKSVYLGICGGFNTDMPELLTGLYGNEFIKVTGTINFVPHQNAMLDGAGRTAADVTAPWISVIGSYYSTAQSAPLYGLDSEYLRPYPALVSTFSEASPAFPVMAWNDADFYSVEEAETAEQILYQQRYRAMTGLDGTTSLLYAEDERILITYNGLCVCVDENSGIWKWIDIAHVNTGSDVTEIRLCNISKLARAAFLKKDCCIVLSSAKQFSEFAEGEILIDIDGWKISLSGNNWHDNSVLIFKYNASEKLADRMRDNKVLKTVLENAYDANGNVKEAYASLVNALEDPQFNGIVMLNTPAAAGKLPDDMKFICDSLDPNKLSAAYVVIESGSVSVKDGAVEFKPSPISGLVSYTDDELTSVGQDETYAFKTVSMSILLKNSRIFDFSCKSELLPSELLGEKLWNPTCMVLRGSLEASSGVQVYRFTFENFVAYTPLNSMVTSITVSDVNLSVSGERGVFSLSADIELVKEDECDVLSYDGLRIQGIRIIKDKESIYDDYGEISVSENAEAREGSVAQSFGTYPVQYLAKQASASPDELGFESITCPIHQGKIGEGWNGIIHKLPLGGSGELGNGSILDLELITAWKESSLYVGMRMSGTLERSFSVQGSIHLGFNSIELIKDNERLFFILHNLALKVFGLSLPQKSADLYLFSDRGKTGWYLGYEDKGR